MTGKADPFQHHPELRDKIVDPLKSNFRAMDLAVLDEKMKAAGAGESWRHSDAHREECAGQDHVAVTRVENHVEEPDQPQFKAEDRSRDQADGDDDPGVQGRGGRRTGSGGHSANRSPTRFWKACGPRNSGLGPRQ